MTIMVICFMVVMGSVVQAVAPTSFWLGETKPPVLLGIVIYCALMRERSVMLSAACLSGLFQDALSMIPLGYSSFCFCSIGWCIERWKDHLYTLHVVTHVFLGAVAHIALLWMLYAFLYMTGRHMPLNVPEGILKNVGAFVGGGTIVPLVFYIMRYMDTKVVGFVKERRWI